MVAIPITDLIRLITCPILWPCLSRRIGHGSDRKNDQQEAIAPTRQPSARLIDE